MANERKEFEAKLRKLAACFRVGWDLEHPVTEEELAAVRTVVHEQWKKEQPARQAREGKNLGDLSTTPVGDPKLSALSLQAGPATETPTGAKAPKPPHSPKKRSKSAKKANSIKTEAHSHKS